jgi:hypothetical protein
MTHGTEREYLGCGTEREYLGYEIHGTEREDHVQLGTIVARTRGHIQLGSIEAYTRNMLPEQAKVRLESTLSCYTERTSEAASLG